MVAPESVQRHYDIVLAKTNYNKIVVLLQNLLKKTEFPFPFFLGLVFNIIPMSVFNVFFVISVNM